MLRVIAGWLTGTGLIVGTLNYASKIPDGECSTITAFVLFNLGMLGFGLCVYALISLMSRYY